MSKVKFNKNGKFAKLVEKIQKLNKQSFAVGYFQSQGVHAGSGLYYTELMRIHEYGEGVRIRPLMHSVRFNVIQDNDFCKQLSVNLKQYIKTESYSIDKLFDHSALHIVHKVQNEVFGNEWYLGRMTVNPTPLVDTAELRDNFAWKVSFRPQVHTL